MIKATLVKRGTDPMGSGEFGAPRGDHTHRGIDYCAAPGDGIHPVFFGEVTKLGYCYADAPEYRYVEVLDADGFKHRYFYVYPAVKVGDRVALNDIIGFAQDISKKYPDSGMKNHVHYEIKTPSGGWVNPEHYVKMRNK